ncbi:hypothetical protein M8C21_001962, partial [Ambrosia artemisiifolia]
SFKHRTQSVIDLQRRYRTTAATMDGCESTGNGGAIPPLYVCLYSPEMVVGRKKPNKRFMQTELKMVIRLWCRIISRGTQNGYQHVGECI